MSPLPLQRALRDGHQDGDPHLPQERGRTLIKEGFGSSNYFSAEEPDTAGGSVPKDGRD